MGRFKGEIADIMRMRGLDVAGLSIESGVPEEDLDAYIYYGKKVPEWEAGKVASALGVSPDIIYESDG